jgi:hypothetical protein
MNPGRQMREKGEEIHQWQEMLRASAVLRDTFAGLIFESGEVFLWLHGFCLAAAAKGSSSTARLRIINFLISRSKETTATCGATDCTARSRNVSRIPKQITGLILHSEVAGLNGSDAGENP